jgi:ribonuclease Z
LRACALTLLHLRCRNSFGAAGADAAIADLRLAWISHIHADHHVGLLSILAARARLLGPGCAPLPVVGPWPLRRFLAEHAAGVEPLAHRFIDLATTTAERQAEQAAGAAAAGNANDASASALFADAVRALGLSRLHSVPVVHCAHAYGAVLEAAAGWKVVYSGDTRPCDALIAAARGASVLIHEATFEDALADEAVSKRHSLTRDAVGVGAAAGAYRTLLTHFSQRYPKIPVIDASYSASTAIAFDMMSVRLTDLAALPSLLPPLRSLFPAEAEEAAAAEGDDVDLFG